MAWRKLWQSAKDESEENFGKAYKNFCDELEKKCKEGDKKARAQAMKISLAEAKLGEGPKYTKYCEFNQDFGPNLDKLEQLEEDYDSAVEKLGRMSVADVLKNKTLAATFRLYCEKVSLVTEITTFVFETFKKSPAEIYATHVAVGSPHELNLAADQRDPWDQADATNDWKAGKGMVLELFKFALTELGPHWEKARVHRIFKSYLIADAGGPSSKKCEAQIGKVREIATAYMRSVQGYGKRWKDLEPDFWTPLNVALNEILEEVDELEIKLALK